MGKSGLEAIRLRGVAPLVGRRAELGTAQEVLDRAIAGRAGILVVRGAAGAGKTRLIDELISNNVHRMVTLTARCTQMAGGSPAGPVELLDQAASLPGASGEPAANHPSLASVRDQLQGHATGPGIDATDESLVRVWAMALLDAVVRRPCAIVIDDAHWADPGTARFIERLCADLAYGRRDQPVLVVVSARIADPDDAIDMTLERVDRMAGATAITLPPLRDVDLRDLVSGFGVPRPDRHFVEMIEDLSDGNPLFVREALREIEARDGFRSIAGRTGTTLAVQDLSPPRELEDMVDRRLRGVDPDLIDLLTLASASADVSIDTSELERLAGPSDRIDHLIDRADELGLLVWNGSSVEFSHPVIKQVLYSRLPRRRRQEIHRSIADHLRSHTPDPQLADRAGEIAHHLTRSGSLAGDLDELTILWLAGRQAFRRCDGGRAALCLEAALLVADRLDLDRNSLGWLHYWAGRADLQDHAIELAMENLEAALDAGKETDDLLLWARAALFRVKHRKASGSESMVGAIDTAEIEQALERIGDDQPGLRARLLEEYGQVALQAGDTATGSAAAEEAAALAEASGDARIQAQCSSTVGLSLLARGRMTEASAGFARAEAKGDEAGADDILLWARTRSALAAWCRADLPAAEHWIAAARQAALVAPLLEARCIIEAIAAAVALAGGDLSAADSTAEEAERLFELTDYSFAPVVLFPTMIESALARGDAVEAAHDLDRWRQSGHRAWEVAAVGLAARSGRPIEPDVVPAVRAMASMATAESLLAPALVGALAEYSVSVGSSEPIAGLVDQVVGIGSGGARMAPGFGILTDRTKGLEAEARGDPESAMRWFGSAIENAGDCLPELARSHLDRARVLHGSRRDEAEVDMAASLRICRQLGLVETGGRVLDLYAAAGESPPADRTATAADAMALLLTDIVESTKLSVERGDVAYLEAVDLHDRVLRQHLAPYGGIEIDNTGDGMLVSFADPTDAVRCAIAVQNHIRERYSRPDASGRPIISIRAGVGYGTPIKRGGRLYGTAVNRTARICAEAGPGEIAIDEVVRAAIAEDVRSHPAGTVRLKGFADPTSVHLVEVA